MVCRPVRVYVGGEVRRPGYYTLTGVQTAVADDISYSTKGGSIAHGRLGTTPPYRFRRNPQHWHHPYTDLSQVQVIRKSGRTWRRRIKTNLNFLSLITEGNESQNIRLFDGDTLNIGRSRIVLRDQLLEAGQSNLGPHMECLLPGAS